MGRWNRLGVGEDACISDELERLLKREYEDSGLDSKSPSVVGMSLKNQGRVERDFEEIVRIVIPANPIHQ